MGYYVSCYYYDRKRSYCLSRHNYFDLMEHLKINNIVVKCVKGGCKIVCEKKTEYDFVIEMINFVKKGLYYYE